MAELVNQTYDGEQMTRKFIGGAAGVARHVIWYLSYQMVGTVRDDPRA
jgi:hypothetical protein